MFPKDFTWGAATSSYQIEGSPTADGKGVSIWDICSKQPGIVVNNENGDVACDPFSLGLSRKIDEARRMA